MSNHSCVICCTRFQASDDTFSTYCGHVFHFPCLSQWLERSKTCPQCRQKTDGKKIHRIYLYSGGGINDTSIKEDAASLQERVDNIEYQKKLLEKDVNHYKNEVQKVNFQASGLRKEVHKLTAEINQKDTQISAFKEQNRYLKELKSENDILRTDYARVKKQLDNINDVKTFLAATNNEADEMIDASDDCKKLSTYVLVLKRELTTAQSNRKQYRDRIKKLQTELNQCQADKLALEKSGRFQSKNNLLNEQNSEGVINTRFDTPYDNTKFSFPITTSREESNNEKIPSSVNDNVSFKLSSPTTLNNELEETDENSTRGTFKVQNLRQDVKRKLSPKKSALNLPTNSILAKRPRPAYDLKAFIKPKNNIYISNGLGSYSKAENFPETQSVVGAIKKPKLRLNSTRKVKSSQVSAATDSNNSVKIDAFVDLTCDSIL